MGNFPGLTMIAGVGHEHRQDVVCTSHGVHPLVEFFQNREALPGRCESAFLVGFRALSRDGLCAAHMERVAQRHRGEPVNRTVVITGILKIFSEHQVRLLFNLR